MALEYAHGAIDILTSDAATTTKTVSGLSFQPKALRFTWFGIQSATDAVSTSANLQRGVGFASGTASRRCVGSFSQDTAATSNCGTVARNDAVVCTTDGAGGSDGEVDLNAINSDGFQLIVDDALPQNLTIFWEAWGGSDISDVTVGDISEPAATGDQDYTATGFVAGATDQVVMLAGVQSVAAVNTAEAGDSGFYVSYVTGTGTGQVVISGNSDDASATMDTDGYAISGECVAMIPRAGGATVQARASFTQFGTDNFRLNWASRGETGRKSVYMAIKGGGWQVGETTINVQTVNNTTTVSGIAFAPKGISLISRGPAEDTSNVSDQQDRFSWGCGSSTSSRRGMTSWDLNATASSTCEIGLAIEYDSVLPFLENTFVITSLLDINAMNSDGFQLIVDDADATGATDRWIGYLAFGDAPAVTPGRPRSLLMGVGR